MRKYDIISGLFLLAISLAICGFSMRLHVGNLTAPGSGFFPLVTGLALGIFSVLILVEASKSSKESIPFWAPGANRKGICLTFLFILTYTLFLERLGFIGTTVLFFFLVSRFVFRHRWSTAIFFALVTSLGTYFLFTILLRAPLPQGILERVF